MYNVITLGYEVGYDFDPFAVQCHGSFRCLKAARFLAWKLARTGIPSRVVTHLSSL